MILGVARVLMNLMQYLSCDDKEITTLVDRTKRRQRKRLEEKLAKTTNGSSRVLLKRQIGDIGPIERRTIVAPSVERLPRVRVDGVRLHWVRGHWHMYWHGKKDGEGKRDLRRHWVQPFQRGVGPRIKDREYICATDCDERDENSRIGATKQSEGEG